jgi:arsenite methyltransferase
MTLIMTSKLIGLALWALLAAWLETAPLLPMMPSPAAQTQQSNPASESGRLTPRLEAEARDKWQKPDEVVKLMQVQPGQVIADIGAGEGYFTRRFALAVGPTGKAIGLDLDSAAVRKMTADAKRRGLTSYEARLVSPDDPLLAPGSVDVIFLCNAYHEVNDRVAYFARVKAALRAGGRLVIIDYIKTKEHDKHASRKEDVVDELGRAGYRLAKEFDLLQPRQMFLEFEPVTNPGTAP